MYGPLDSPHAASVHCTVVDLKTLIPGQKFESDPRVIEGLGNARYLRKVKMSVWKWC